MPRKRQKPYNASAVSKVKDKFSAQRDKLNHALCILSSTYTYNTHTYIYRKANIGTQCYNKAKTTM